MWCRLWNVWLFKFEVCLVCSKMLPTSHSQWNHLTSVTVLVHGHAKIYNLEQNPTETTTWQRTGHSSQNYDWKNDHFLARTCECQLTLLSIWVHWPEGSHQFRMFGHSARSRQETLGWYHQGGMCTTSWPAGWTYLQSAAVDIRHTGDLYLSGASDSQACERSPGLQEGRRALQMRWIQTQNSVCPPRSAGWLASRRQGTNLFRVVPKQNTEDTSPALLVANLGRGLFSRRMRFALATVPATPANLIVLQQKDQWVSVPHQMFGSSNLSTNTKYF